MGSRRDFFSFKKTPSVINLPYIKGSIDVCTECRGYCVNACEESIIFKKEGEIPYLDFKNKGCIFCKKCAFVCEEKGKAVLNSLMENIIEGKAKIDVSLCLSYHQVICLSCQDVCKTSIKFSGMFYPEILNTCTACGLCVSICPQGAISIVESQKGK
ncbi:4Fe-4S binding protein [Helicobacter cappadocius]|uniref:4Fe-4S binding protein n=1 Tax=Helicobacter cappadocius TaxID=3063998 RepID=A0AA90Q427_9HELI|nr:MULTISPECIES: 4Fe-4S binding protein [unclassified Helicobacter]MDO7253915.1 4Fe-4S binding protein [Helicobacter sp. faydin-H75]MDP2539788.1 4Fe-4S binding protein [Helicobacter sp. faydin-H76]